MGRATSGDGSTAGVAEAIAAIEAGKSAALAALDQIGAHAFGMRRDFIRGQAFARKASVVSVAATMKTFMTQWPTAMFDVATGKVVKLDTYSLPFVRAMSSWAIDRILAMMGQVGGEVARLGTGTTVDNLDNWVTDVNRVVQRRFVPYSRAAHAAQAEGKIALRLPEFRADVLKLFVMVLDGETKAAAAAAETSWMSLINFLTPIASVFKFIVDAAADLVAAPVLFLGDLLLKLAIGAGAVYGAYWFATREKT
jgi:hypothetical protein